ncbi:elongation factor P maturation arginine rhamnosyltransferase EarP [Cupriavidus basilensis]
MPAQPDRAIRSWDIFCTVIDNFGDIGVCWRLARQLAQEAWPRRTPLGGRSPPALRALPRPRYRRAPAGACWRDDPSWRRLDQESAQESTARFAGVTPHDAVIEAFACDLPGAIPCRHGRARAKAGMAQPRIPQRRALGERHHGMASPHPRLPLVKHFFFPGFEPGTGGVLRETMLGMQREHFRASPAAQASLWHRLGFEPIEGALEGQPVRLPQCRPARTADPMARWLGAGPAAWCRRAWPRGKPANGSARPIARLAAFSGVAALTVQVVPFVRQEHYDELLWLCDLNFVRGEDSFVRAQWAGRPFVWQIYPQSDAAHMVKLDAFLALIVQRMDTQRPTGGGRRTCELLAQRWNKDD